MCLNLFYTATPVHFPTIIGANFPCVDKLLFYRHITELLWFGNTQPLKDVCMRRGNWFGHGLMERTGHRVNHCRGRKPTSAAKKKKKRVRKCAGSKFYLEAKQMQRLVEGVFLQEDLWTRKGESKCTPPHYQSHKTVEHYESWECNWGRITEEGASGEVHGAEWVTSVHQSLRYFHPTLSLPHSRGKGDNMQAYNAGSLQAVSTQK